MDFTSHVPLVSWFIAAPIAVADKSVLNPKATEGEFEKRLEILQSLKEAPLLFGMDAEELEQSLNSDCVLTGFRRRRSQNLASLRSRVCSRRRALLLRQASDSLTPTRGYCLLWRQPACQENLQQSFTTNYPNMMMSSKKREASL